MAVQVDPIKRALKVPVIKRLKLKHDELLSSFSFKCYLRHYNKVSLPVLTAVARILEDDLPPRTAVEEIMNLPQVPEV